MSWVEWPFATLRRAIWTTRVGALLNVVAFTWNAVHWSGWWNTVLVLINVAGFGLSLRVEQRWHTIFANRAARTARYEMQWFGRSWGAPICQETKSVPVPVGEPCAWCDEPIAADDDGFIVPHVDGNAATGRPYHYECQMRTVVGGLNHQLKRCTCCGGDLPPDPAGLPKREAARVAAAYANQRMTDAIIEAVRSKK